MHVIKDDIRNVIVIPEMEGVSPGGRISFRG